MTIIELPEEYRWEISKVLRHKDGHDGECMTGLNPTYQRCDVWETRYRLSYQKEIQRERDLGTREVSVPGKHWWNSDRRVLKTNFETVTEHPVVDSIILPREFDSDVIRENAWTMLYDLALKDPLNDPRNKFVGVYPPKTLAVSGVLSE